MLDFVDIHCPYCGESIEIAVDTSAGGQSYVEDCQVCCRPMNVRVTVDEEEGVSVSVSAENEGG
ncbi:putative Zn finger protein [Luteibacter sp. Sphag1AF]|uniref:CPXCG motif-containing cysteine-rich protein n=1 Tax=Luteibacter sp. Sphag1AF TaxID=2587031 RepID=UPI001621AB34|nr:CPXCG motif-containing cysteine-rich protein [Luteibacter sp. Sphag1AF]MBB3225994.1 putative Zn finger protein [Luteibacter sp. Sphag1AF]